MNDFIRATAIRAVRTAAQTAVSTIGVGAAGLFNVDWETVASVSGLAAVLSVLTSLATGLPEVGDD